MRKVERNESINQDDVHDKVVKRKMENGNELSALGVKIQLVPLFVRP